VAGQTNRDFDAEVLSRMAEGESLRHICSDLKAFGCPAASTFCGRVIDDKSFAERYARARELQCEAWADEIREESHKCRFGEIETTKPDGGVEIRKVDCVDRSRLAVDALKWTLAKLHPKKYGDKVEQTQIHEVGSSIAALMEDIRKGKTRPNDRAAS
jgi:hypothetical protein